MLEAIAFIEDDNPLPALAALHNRVLVFLRRVFPAVRTTALRDTEALRDRRCDVVFGFFYRVEDEGRDKERREDRRRCEPATTISHRAAYAFHKPTTLMRNVTAPPPMPTSTALPSSDSAVLARPVSSATCRRFTPAAPS